MKGVLKIELVGLVLFFLGPGSPFFKMDFFEFKIDISKAIYIKGFNWSVTQLSMYHKS